MYKKALSLLLLSLIILSCNNKPTEPKPSINVMAYYVPAEGYMPHELPLDQLTHIIYSFSNVIDGEMKFREPEKADSIMQALVDQKKNHPDLKVMIACGGWGADGFSDAAVSEESRLKFARSAVEFIEKFKLDGLDMDWEYPALDGAGIKARPEDTQNFTLLMKCLREHLDSLDRPQTLTFASAGWVRYYDFIELNEVMKYVDFMNVMTYDQIGHTTPFTGHHTALGFIRMDDLVPHPFGKAILSWKEEMKDEEFKWHPRSVEHIIEFCLEQGVKPEQLVIGGAFYGRSWKGVHPENNGMYQENGGSHIGWCAYHQIRKEFEQKNGFERFWDSTAKAPYLYNATDSILFTYDDTLSVRLKTQYAKDKNLGGIMFWELGNDTKEPNSLLNAIYEEALK